MASRALPDLRARLQFDVSDLNRAQSAARDFGSRLPGTFKPAEESLGRISAHFKQLPINIAAGLGIYTGLGAVFQGLGGAISSTVSSGIQFQDTMNTLQAVTGASTRQMAALSDRAIALGADLSLPNTSAADAATAMTELAKAGLSVSDSMAAAKGTLQLAAAAGVSEGDAAQYAAAALNAFHLPGSEANRIADLLAASANASAASIQEMADAMRQSAAVFAAAHIPVEDLVAAIAELANAGIRGQDAGTSLKQALLQLQTPSKQQTALMKELNFSLYDQHGRMRSLRDIIGELQVGTKGLTQQQRDYALGVIFGSDAIRIANVLISEGTAGFDKMKEAVTKTGAAQDVASAKARGLGGAVRGLQSEWETLQLTLFLKVTPALEAVVRVAAEKLPGVQTMISGWVDQVGRWADSIKKLADQAAGLFKGPTAQTPTKTSLPVEGLTPGIGESSTKQGADQLGRQFADAIVQQAGKIADAIINAVRQAINQIQWFELGKQAGLNAAPFALGFVDQLFMGILIAIKEHPTEAIMAGLTVFLTPARLAQPILRAIPGLRFLGIPQFNQLGNDLAGALIRGLLERMAIEEGGWAIGLGRLISAAAGLPARLRELGLQGAEALGRTLGAGLEPLVNVFRVWVRQIDEIVTYLVSRLPQIGGEAMGGFRGQLGIWAEQALIGMRILVQQLIETVGRLVEPFTTLAGRAMGGIRDVIVTIGEAIRGFFVSLWDAIWNFLVARWSSILATAGERFGAIRDNILGWLRTMWADQVSSWDAVWSFLGARFNAIWSLASERWGAIRNTIVDWATSARDRVGQLWEDMVGAAGGAGGRIWGAIKSGLNSAIGVLNSFSHGINSVLGTFGVPRIPDIPGLAAGGVLRAGSGGGRVENITAVVGEGSAPEYVIPTDNRFRGRAIELLHNAAHELGLIGLAGGGILNWLPSAGAMVQGPGGGFSHQHLNAWDFMAAMNSPLYAGLPGSYSQYTSGYGGGYGNSILFNLAQGGQVILAHLAQVIGSGAAAVGKLIGLTDNTGFSTGPHLHFEVRGSGLNPLTGGYSGGIPGLQGLIQGVDLTAIIRGLLSPITDAAHAAANALSQSWAKTITTAIIDKVSENVLSKTGLGGAATGEAARYDPSIDPGAPSNAIWTKLNPTVDDVRKMAAMVSGGQLAREALYDPASPAAKLRLVSPDPNGYVIARAGGGPVVPNRVYMVGERGPELFSPDTSGTIIPSGSASMATVENLLGQVVGLLGEINGTPQLSRRDASRRYAT